MKSTRLLLIVATFLLALFVPFSGASAKKPTPPPPEDNRMLVTNVDVSSGTIDIKIMSRKSTQTYKVDSVTRVIVNGNPSTLATVQVGMQVRDLVERDPKTLDSLSVSTADAPPQAPAKG